MDEQLEQTQMQETAVKSVESTTFRPKKTVAMMYSGRFGVILSNIAITCTILSLVSILIPILSFFGYVIGIMIAICTLGLIMIIVPGYWSGISKGGEILGRISGFLMTSWVYITPIAIGASLLSIVFLALDKTKSHKGRIVTSSIVGGGAIVILILLAMGVGA